MYFETELAENTLCKQCGSSPPPINCVNLVSTCLILVDTDKMYVVQELLENEFQNMHCKNRW